MNCAMANGESWLDGWTYRKSHIIGAVSGSGYDYQVSVTVDFGDGSDSGDIVYVDGNCQTDFDDIRFTDNDGETVLDYWLQDKTDSDFAIFWVKIDDSLDSADVTIYVYYDNDSATSLSDGDDTFILFDHFDDASLGAEWTSSGTPVESGSTVVFADDDGILTTSSVGLYNVSLLSYCVADEQDVEFGGFLNTFNLGAVEDKAVIVNSDNVYANDFDKLRCSSSEGVGGDAEWNIDNDDIRSYCLYEVSWFSGMVKYYQNGDLLATESSGNVPDTNMKVRYLVWDSSQESTMTLDWCAVRKCVVTEPDHGSWGSEETEGSEPEPEVDSFRLANHNVLIFFVVIFCVVLVVGVVWYGKR